MSKARSSSSARFFAARIIISAVISGLELKGTVVAVLSDVKRLSRYSDKTWSLGEVVGDEGRFFELIK